MKNYEWFRKLTGGIWYKRRFTKRASELTFAEGKEYWSRNGTKSSYCKVIYYEDYTKNLNQ